MRGKKRVFGAGGGTGNKDVALMPLDEQLKPSMTFPPIQVPKLGEMSDSDKELLEWYTKLNNDMYQSPYYLRVPESRHEGLIGFLPIKKSSTNDLCCFYSE
jgi:hypothetical protein